MSKHRKTDSGNMSMVPVVPQQETALEKVDPYLADEDEYGGLTQVMPRRKFDGKDSGMFENTLSGEKASELRLVVLAMNYSNVLFAPIEASSGPSWYCRSNNNVDGILNPEIGQWSGVTGNCSTCQKAKWGGIDGKTKPECSHGLNLLCIDRDTNAPFVMNASRTSLRPWENILNGLRQVKKPPYSHEITVSGEYHEKGKLKWYSMKPVLGALLSPEEVMGYRAMRKNLIDPFEAKVREDIEVDAPPVQAAAPVQDDDVSIEDLPF